MLINTFNHSYGDRSLVKTQGFPILRRLVYRFIQPIENSFV